MCASTAVEHQFARAVDAVRDVTGALADGACDARAVVSRERIGHCPPHFRADVSTQRLEAGHPAFDLEHLDRLSVGEALVQVVPVVHDRLAARPTPEDEPPFTDAVEIAVGVEHTCVTRADRTLSCWGSNRFSSLGAGASRVCSKAGASTGHFVRA